MATQLPEIMVPYTSPVDPSLHPLFAIVLLGVGLTFFAWFLSYEVATSGRGIHKRKRSLFKELFIASLASVFLGFGTLFLLLWVGIWV